MSIAAILPGAVGRTDSSYGLDGDVDLMAMDAPSGVGSVLWRLSSADERRSLLADADQGDSPSNARSGARQVELCTVEVRYTPVAGGLANHAFIVTQDGRSTDYFRGGPSAGGPASSGASAPTEQLGSASGGASSGASRSGSSDGSNSSNGTSPGAGRGGTTDAGGPWGPIETIYGAYRPGTIDWTTSPTATTVVDRRPGSCDALEAEFARHADAIEAAHIPYNPLGANSNATARTILERAGIDAGRPAVLAPGWSTTLP